MKDELKTFGRNLRRQRLILGWDQELSAAYLEVSPTMYRRYEAGGAEPGEEVLQRLVEKFGLPLGHYFRDNAVYQHRFFRALKRQTARDKALIEQATIDASRRLRDYRFLEEATQEIVPNERLFLRNVPARRRNIEETALKVREYLVKMGLTDNELLGRVVERLGVKIILLPFRVESCFGFTLKLDEEHVAIVVNSDKEISEERRLFTLAHEIGHILLHSHGPSIESMSDEEVERIEDEANRFAAQLLMPQASFDEEWQASSGVRWMERVLAVKQAFRVSYKTVLHRLQACEGGVGRQSLYARFCQQYQVRYGVSLSGHKEPFPYSFASGGLSRFARLCRKAYEVEAISLSRLAELLEIPFRKARELVNEWA